MSSFRSSFFGSQTISDYLQDFILSVTMISVFDTTAGSSRRAQFGFLSLDALFRCARPDLLFFSISRYSLRVLHFVMMPVLDWVRCVPSSPKQTDALLDLLRFLVSAPT